MIGAETAGAGRAISVGGTQTRATIAGETAGAATIVGAKLDGEMTIGGVRDVLTAGAGSDRSGVPPANGGWGPLQ